MNQTKKRLSIINLAISMTDIETIQLQILKLRILHSDNKIQEIITTLQDENYAQAQAQISTYIKTPNNEILQRTFQHEKEYQEAKDKAIIEEFDLFTVNTPEPATENKVLNLDDMMQIDKASKVSQVKTHENIDFDSLLNVKTNDIMPDNITINIQDPLKNDFWDTLESEEIDNNPIEKDTFFDNHETTVREINIDDFPKIEEDNNEENEPEIFNEEAALDHMLEKINPTDETTSSHKEEIEDIKETESIEEVKELEVLTVEQIEEMYEESEPIEESQDQENSNKNNSEEVNETVDQTQSYKTISYIDQKFKNMQVQYPALNENLDQNFSSVKEWLGQIANEGYSEEDVETVLQKVTAIKEESPTEAAELLLISAATESKFAQFQLARTLFKGDILQQNTDEAFSLLNRLAVNEDYPEAVCDLAQLYEYGIGTVKDKKKAELLYEEAVNLGIQRALPHYERLKKENKGFLSFFSK